MRERQLRKTASTDLRKTEKKKLMGQELTASVSLSKSFYLF